MSDSPLLDQGTVREAFARLAARLSRRHLVANAYLFGGGAILMAFDDQRRTKDLDARFTSTSDVQAEVDAVADEMGLPRWWLNEQGTAYLPSQDDPHPAPVFDHPNLRVMRVSDRHLLAMKAAASRRNTADIEDIRLLAGRLGLTTPEQVIALHDEVFPDEPLPEAKRTVVAEALAGQTPPQLRSELRRVTPARRPSPAARPPTSEPPGSPRSPRSGPRGPRI